MIAEQAKRIASLTIKTTADGSPTLFVPELNEHYHSVHGALQESKHVFIEAGLRPFLQRGIPEIQVLEVGFGTGLNAILTLAEAEKTGANIHFQTIEAYPLPAGITDALNLNSVLQNELPASNFALLHSINWEEKTGITPHFSITKQHCPLQEANLPAAAYHVIYFDAFAPEKQPELWQEDIFKKLYLCLQPGGAFVTYCAKGTVKRQLRAVGFLVESLPGPPGKREMIRASRTTGTTRKPV
ncbi:MAG: SAM-dependent methyltransferase [Chitinophagaceae bacterium]|nr:MAG: SAM-dependent methyltransferase [Chitinophagaceae bacterium]